MDEINLLINERQIDILCISESWLLTHTPDSHANIPNFKLYRQDRGKGGGACIYVHNDLHSASINTGVPKHEGVDEICIQVQCRKLPSILINSIYRHPKACSTSFDHIEDTLRALIMRKKTFFLLGDLNDNLLLPNSKLSRIIANNKLTQIINTPTRVTPTSATLLDVIITNKPDLITHSYVIPCTVADHELIGASVNILKPKRQPITVTKRDLRKYNSDLLCSHILEETSTLNEILRTDDVDKQVSILTSVITTSLDRSAPISNIVLHRPPAPWINDEIKEALAERKKAQRILKNHRYNVIIQQNYKEIKKNVKRLLTTSKKNYYHQELHTCKNNTAATWNTLKTIIPSKTQSTTHPPLENISEKAEDFNNFFANVGLTTYESTQESLTVENRNHLNEAPNIPVAPSTPTNLALFRPQPVDQNTIILTVKQLQNTKSFGCDNISLRFIKDSLIVIIFYLTTIINTSIVTGIFPASWKNAVVTPLYKNGNPDEIGNYRPISLLPIFFKNIRKS